MARLRNFRQIPAVLVFFFLFGPPLTFSTNLPTACMVFFKKQLEPSGPCGHKALFPKVNALEEGLGLVLEPIAENGLWVAALIFSPDRIFPSVILSNFPPLRC
jgi:hypothetical protein